MKIMVLICVFSVLTHPSQGLVQDRAPTHHPTPSPQGVDLIPHLGKIDAQLIERLLKPVTTDIWRLVI